MVLVKLLFFWNLKDTPFSATWLFSTDPSALKAGQSEAGFLVQTWPSREGLERWNPGFLTCPKPSFQTAESQFDFSVWLEPKF